MKETKRWLSLFIATLSVATITMGCGTLTEGATPTTSPTPSKQLFANWPPLLNDFRFHWSAEPGIDVTIGPAMIARAYLESYTLATLTLNPDNVYPGFYRATPENVPREGDYMWQLVNIRPVDVPLKPAPEEAVPRFGYEAFHFLELAPFGKGYRALICSNNYPTFLESDKQPGKFVSVGLSEESGRLSPGSGVMPHRVEFTQHDPRVGLDPPAPVTAAQRGPAPAPEQDVFGNWFITGAGTLHWGRLQDDGSLQSDLMRRCEEAMPQSEAERVATVTVRDTPPPHGEAIPGWPTKAQ